MMETVRPVPAEPVPEGPLSPDDRERLRRLVGYQRASESVCHKHSLTYDADEHAQNAAALEHALRLLSGQPSVPSLAAEPSRGAHQWSEEAVDAAAKALWKIGNERIGHRDWGTVWTQYVYEARTALEAADAIPAGRVSPAEPAGEPPPSALIVVSYKDLAALQQENQRLVEQRDKALMLRTEYADRLEAENQRLREALAAVRGVLAECSQDYNSPYFTDRHGTGPRLTAALRDLREALRSPGGTGE